MKHCHTRTYSISGNSGDIDATQGTTTIPLSKSPKIPEIGGMRQARCIVQSPLSSPGIYAKLGSPPGGCAATTTVVTAFRVRLTEEVHRVSE